MKYIKNLLLSFQEKPLDNTNEKLAELLTLINDTFTKIKACTHFSESQTYFDILQKIQEIISTLFFTGIITIPQELRKFIRDFDRLDDPWLRNYFFKQLKDNNYFL